MLHTLRAFLSLEVNVMGFGAEGTDGVVHRKMGSEGCGISIFMISVP